MPLQPGGRLGPYQVLSVLGAGGMGEVWRARDARLDRDVALKVLPEAFVADPERLARFAREAKVLASLNHPNIGGIHGVEEADGVKALVLELVEGPTLADRLARGAIPIDEALPIARQIAEALEAAHEQGIIHRDLKPANIKVRADGTVKVLDFGLARVFDPQLGAAQADLSHSPTLTLGAAATQMGVILGTAAYMAPEQARGKPVDKRADVWAFGVVLFEMLAGRRLFAGEETSDTLALVLTRDPDWGALPPAVPWRVRELLRRCLQKDPRARLRDIGDARLEIVAASSDADAAPPGSRAGELERPAQRRVLVAAAMGLILGTLVTAITLMARRTPSVETPMVSRLSIALPPEAPFFVESWPNSGIAISRDGSRIVYCALTENETRRLYLRRLDELEVKPIPGTEGAYNPFFSPDGEWVAFFTQHLELKKVSLRGGSPVTLAGDVVNAWFVVGAWTDDGRMVFDAWNAGLSVVDADGGAVTRLTTPTEAWHQDPQALPGSTTILYFAKGDVADRVEAVSLDGGEARIVLENASHPRYLASGHLLFTRDGNLMVAPFDRERLEVTGPAASVSLDVIVDNMGAASPLPQLAVSQRGTLAYAPRQATGMEPSTLAWVDRGGQVEEIAALPIRRPAFFALSPNGRQVAMSRRSGAKIKLELYDLASNTLTGLAEQSQEFPSGPVWSPDGRSVVFARYGIYQGGVLSHQLDSSTPPKELVSLPGTYFSIGDVSRDGRFLAFSFVDTKTNNGDIWILDLTAPGSAAQPFAKTQWNENGAAFSPDGRWVAYASDERGLYEVHVRRFPGGEAKRQVSTNGGAAPQWSSDGRELFFQSGSGEKMMATAVRMEPELGFEEPRVLFQGHFLYSVDAGRAYAVGPDGRFLMIRSELPGLASELVVVQNWFAEIERLAPHPK
jgi:Tol biopolymer transport system component